MCIQVDSRAGSKDMAPLLRALGMEVELTMMPFGDLSFYGTGIEGCPVSVGLEIKSIFDALACLVSGRFAGHQLPGLIQSYDHVWLLISGECRSRPTDGVLEYKREGRGGGQFWSEIPGQKRWLWRDFESWLATMQVCGGVRVQRCRDWNEGALFVKTLFQWFQKDDHHAHLPMYSGVELIADKALLVKPSLVRRISAELPRIGVEKSIAVAAHFHSVSEMMSASEKEWTEIDGIGKGIAKIVYKAIHNSNSNGNGKH